MFHYRESELAKLNRRYQNRQFECIVIYGRRRVGKTALINLDSRKRDEDTTSRIAANP